MPATSVPARDITDLKRTQEEHLAKQKLESVGTLAGGIAHDFNNLLGGVLATRNWRWRILPVARVLRKSWRESALWRFAAPKSCGS